MIHGNDRNRSGQQQSQFEHRIGTPSLLLNDDPTSSAARLLPALFFSGQSTSAVHRQSRSACAGNDRHPAGADATPGRADGASAQPAMDDLQGGEQIGESAGYPH